jgi:hypothetical protein
VTFAHSCLAGTALRGNCADWDLAVRFARILAIGTNTDNCGFVLKLR